MKKMILLFSFAVTACASAIQPREIGSVKAQEIKATSSHIRFWRGFKQDDQSQQKFQQNLIQKLIPATVQVGQNKGLISYVPVFPRDIVKTDTTLNFIPDEIAFIQYMDEETYKKLSATSEFKDYGKMHYEPGAFIKKNAQGFSSGSLVSKTISEQEPISFANEAFAIDFGQTVTTWQADDVYFTVFVLEQLTKATCAEKLLKNLVAQTKQKNLKAFALLYDPNYILVYSRQEKGSAQMNLPIITSCFKQNKSISVPGNRSQMEKGDSGLNFRL